MARPTGAQRTSRLIALLGQLTPWTRIRIADLASEIGTTPAELAADLETLSMCGVAPYDPGSLMPLFVEDGFVEVGGELPALDGPVRLSAAEARALAAALQVAGFTAGDELTARLLGAAAGSRFNASELEHTVRTATSAHAHLAYQVLAHAVETNSVVSLEYVTAGSDESTCRDIEPMALFAERGAWYVTAWCRRAGGWRTFRLDRMRSAEPTGEVFTSRDDAGLPQGDSAFDAVGLPMAALRFAPDEQFIEREWPAAIFVESDSSGATTVEIPFSGSGWLIRRVASRLGSVEVLGPESLRAAVSKFARDEAARLHGAVD